METAKDAGRRISLSGMLKKLGVSRSGYQAFLKRGPSVSQIRKERVKQRILELYNDSNQNYGAPKIARLLQKEGDAFRNALLGCT
jgi:hypothetical protein